LFKVHELFLKLKLIIWLIIGALCKRKSKNQSTLYYLDPEHQEKLLSSTCFDTKKSSKIFLLPLELIILSSQ